MNVKDRQKDGDAPAAAGIIGDIEHSPIRRGDDPAVSLRRLPLRIAKEKRKERGYRQAKPADREEKNVPGQPSHPEQDHRYNSGRADKPPTVFFHTPHPGTNARHYSMRGR